MYERLSCYYGPQHWWPAQSAFEVIVGAILTQNTAWINVEKALINLKSANLLSIPGILHTPEKALAELVRPSGTFRQKARNLKAFVTFLYDRYQGSLTEMCRMDPTKLREELLQVHGIGPETADSILLYALHKPVFVVDTYTRRILSRHGQCREDIAYHDLQALIENRIEKEVTLYNEFHALMVRVGKEFCRKTAQCRGCPLEPLLETAAGDSCVGS